RAHSRAHRSADDEIFGAPHRLHPAQHGGAAGPGALQLPLQPRAPDARQMTFLTPLFLAGLATLAVPVLVHLIQRERKRVVEFPSLMFVRRIPYQSVRRRRIRHWALLLLRAAAITLIVIAFARPFLRQGASAAAATSGAREIVILLDQS